MADLKLRANIAGHEFEAEGNTENVQAQFEFFTRIVLKIANVEPLETQKPAEASAPAEPRLADMLRWVGRTPFLKTPAKLPDAVLLVLLAHKEFNKNEVVSGADIMRSLRESGIRIPRADHIINRHADNGIVVVSGHRRLRRYRLTQVGIDRAQQLVRESK